MARVEEVNPAINAVVALDVERARAAAAAADEETARGDDLGPLHGLPMTVKDVWETEGLVTTAGAPELKDHVPTTDALAVARLKQAGADRLREDQHAALRRRLPDLQRGLRRHQQPLGRHPHDRRVLRGLGGRGRDRHVADRARQRHRRLHPQPGPLQRRVRPEAVPRRRAEPWSHPRATGDAWSNPT